MRTLLGLAAVLEAVMGLALMIAPAVVARLLLGGDLPGAGAEVGRVAGLALLSLGVACWPPRGSGRSLQALWAMLTYNPLVAAYLVFLGIRGEQGGGLLWPAAALHALLTLLLAGAWIGNRQGGEMRSDR
jgi:hypothetical protein